MNIAGFSFKSPLTLGLALACVVLGLVLAIELLLPAVGKGSPASSQVSGKEDDVSLAPKKRFSLPPEGQFSEVVERPLFVKERRPPKPGENQDPQKKEKQVQLGQYKLTGVILGPDQRFALLLDAAKKKTERVDEGKDKGGWTLKEVHTDSVLLTRDGNDEALPLVRKTPDNVKLLQQHATAKKRNTPAKAGQTQETQASQRKPRGGAVNKPAQPTP
jgi:hypothetical protein